MKLALLFLAAAFAAFSQSEPAATPPGRVFPAADLQRQTTQLVAAARTERSASASLAQYGNHELLLVARERDGSAELHAHFNDIMIVQSGNATLVSGGEVIAPQSTSPGEVRGSGIRGGVRRDVHAGDVIHIAPNTPHQFLVPTGTTLTYIAVKVREP